jgi:hypothetical protein
MNSRTLSRLAPFLSLAAALALSSLTQAAAQQQGASLRGSVTDANGAAVPGALVTLANESTGAERAATTHEGGEYQFQQLQPGTYRLRVEKGGFRASERRGLALLLGTPQTLNVELAVGEVGETVTVEEGSTSALNTQDAALGATLGEREVTTLPAAGRNPIPLLSLQPGVVFTGESDPDRLLLGLNNRLDDREGATFGVRGNQSNVNLDGAEVGDTESQAAFGLLLPVTLDSVREFRVTTNGANASEFSTGGPAVSLVTRSGTNDWTGNLRLYHRNDATAANAFFNNREGFDRPKLLRNVFGGSLGGPLRRDRAFFFLDYEGRVEESEFLPDPTFSVRVPSDTLRQGIISYRNRQGRVVALTPAEVRAIDPAGLGVNPAMLALFDLYPRPNAPSGPFDDALNFGRFRFSAPARTKAHVSTARLDFNLTADGRHALFWRGTLADIAADLRGPSFPGLPPRSRFLNDSRGMAFSYTAQLSPSLVNNFTWGHTVPRHEDRRAVGDGFAPNPLTTPFSLGGDGSPPERGSRRRVTINDFSDDVTWARVAHSVQFGAMMRLSRNRRASDVNAFAEFKPQPGSCRGDAGCLAPVNALRRDSNPANDPANNAASAVRSAFFALTGPILFAEAHYSLDPKTGRYRVGRPRQLEFVEDLYEAYAQDTWRVRPGLTVTAGLRYSLAPPIYEANGLQLRPTVDVQTWFAGRVADMRAGLPADRTPFITFDKAGKANERPSWHAPDYNNFAPRVAVAWSPAFDGGLLGGLFGGGQKGVIRAGFGVYHERVGGALAYTTDQYGSPGLSRYETSADARPFSLADAPRFTGTCTLGACANLPPLSLYVQTPEPVTLPFTPTFEDALEGNFVIDNRLRSPYTMHANLSFQRELPGRTILDVGYVGTFGRKLLAKADVAQYYGELVDPASGQTMWGAFRQIADLIGPDPNNPRIDPFDPAALAAIRPIAFFENLMPNMPLAGFGAGAGLTPTQAFYQYVTSFGADWSTALSLLDFDPYIFGTQSPWNSWLDPEGDGAVLFFPQFNNLPAWLNWGRSNYHGGQLTLRRSFGRAQFSVNYTFSKSIDNTSAAENATNNLGEFFYDTGQIADAFRPYAQRARSDFDLTHNLNAFWSVDLPFGRGRRFAGRAGAGLEALLGGWQFSGVLRWRSGFPLSPFNGFNNPTNTFGSAFATVLGRLRSGPTSNDTSGRPNLFRDPAAARALLAYTRPGEVGSRNVVNGPGYFTVDLALHKTFRPPWAEGHALQFRAAAYNATNRANFSMRPPYFSGYNFNIDAGPSFGRFTRTAGPRGGAREVEFALRYTF